MAQDHLLKHMDGFVFNISPWTISNFCVRWRLLAFSSPFFNGISPLMHDARRMPQLKLCFTGKARSQQGHLEADVTKVNSSPDVWELINRPLYSSSTCTNLILVFCLKCTVDVCFWAAYAHGLWWCVVKENKKSFASGLAALKVCSLLPCALCFAAQRTHNTHFKSRLMFPMCV